MISFFFSRHKYSLPQWKFWLSKIHVGAHVTIFMVSDAFLSVCPTHNRTHSDASTMQHFQQSERVDILKSIQMGSSLETYPDALTICDAFRCVQKATFSSITTLFDTKTSSDPSCCCIRRNAFENLQKFFKNTTLYFTIDPFLSLHDIPIST